ncbi:transposase [Brucella intermedia LMG 3301]|nr:transposase [Brucella intermedia LMG 3301]
MIKRLQQILMEYFELARHVQRGTSIHDPIYNLRYFPRNKINAADRRELRQTANTMWREIAWLKSARQSH